MILSGPILLAIGLLYRLGFGATLMANIMISFAEASGNRTPQSVSPAYTSSGPVLLRVIFVRVHTCTSFSIDPYMLL